MIPEHELAKLQDKMTDVCFDPVQADHELWAFLNMNIPPSCSKARNFFDKAKELQGFDVWRRIMVPMAPRTVSRRVDMHGDVHNPPKAKRLGELVDHIEAWDRLHERYQEMGGMEVSSDEQCLIILRMLSSDAPPSLVMSLHVDILTTSHTSHI